MESQDIYINTNNELEIDTIKLQKMAFIYNAVESGWKIHKQNNSYVFQKNTKEGKKFI